MALRVGLAQTAPPGSVRRRAGTATQSTIKLNVFSDFSCPCEPSARLGVRRGLLSPWILGSLGTKFGVFCCSTTYFFLFDTLQALPAAPRCGARRAWREAPAPSLLSGAASGCAARVGLVSNRGSLANVHPPHVSPAGEWRARFGACALTEPAAAPTPAQGATSATSGSTRRCGSCGTAAASRWSWSGERRRLGRGSKAPRKSAPLPPRGGWGNFRGGADVRPGTHARAPPGGQRYANAESHASVDAAW